MATSLSVAARNLLVQDPELNNLGLIGKDTGPEAIWPLWVWADTPQRRIENTQKCGVVITEGDPWTSRNPHNTAYFPTLVVDIWADPTRNPDRSVRRLDADDKILRIARSMNKILHTVNRNVPADAPAWLGLPGHTRVWGSATEISTRTGVQVISSVHVSGPSFRDMAHNDGGRMARYVYNLETF